MTEQWYGVWKFGIGQVRYTGTLEQCQKWVGDDARYTIHMI